MSKTNGGQEDRMEGLRSALDQEYTWPASYVFKFIVPATSLNHLLALLDSLEYTTRESKTGKYVSVTCEAEMQSSDAVIALYRRASGVAGVVAL